MYSCGNAAAGIQQVACAGPEGDGGVRKRDGSRVTDSAAF